MPDIKQLQYFIAVAEQLHIGRAAEILFITQPPLTRQIQLLEQALGVALLVRHAKGVSLTAAGQRFYEDAQKIVAALGEACRNAQNIAQGRAGALSVGFMMHAAYHIVPKLTKTFITRYPDVVLQLQEVIPSELIKRVQSGEFDAVIMLRPQHISGLVVHTLCEEPLRLALSASHPLANSAIESGQQLANEAFIATPMAIAPELRQALQHYGAKFGFNPKVILETQLQQTIVSLVAEGLGVALVPAPVSKMQLPQLLFKDIPAAPRVEYVLVWREDSLNPALTSLVECAALSF